MRKATIALVGVLVLVLPVWLGVAAPGIVAAVAHANGQQTAATADTPQRFDVAAIRPCDPEPVPPGGRSGGGNGIFSPGRANLNCFVVKNLIDVAFVNNRAGRPAELPTVRIARSASPDPLDSWARSGAGSSDGPQRVRGGPPWVYTDKYSIEATAANLDPSQPRAPDRSVMLGPMLRALLEDRFKLKLHEETEQVPMWALTVAKGGPKAKANGPDGYCTTLDPAKGPGPGMDEEIAMVRRGEKPICGHGIIGGRHDGNEALALGNQDMAGVARALSLYTDLLIVDRTGITDRFNLYLEFAPDDFARGRYAGADSNPTPPTAASLQTVLQEKLGLKLEPIKGPRGYLVIDHIERPVPDQPASPPARARGAGR